MRRGPLLTVGVTSALLAFLPAPRPSLDLRACSPVAVGAHGVSCDIGPLKRESPWLGGSITVLEDGVPLREVREARRVRKEGMGSWAIEDSVLTWSSIGRARPTESGAAYVARPAGAPTDLLPPAGRVGALTVALAVAALLARRRDTGLFIGAVALAAVCVLFQVGATITHAPVHVDAGSSLPTARDLAEGAIPYEGILFNYTPLGVYLLAGARVIGPSEPVAAHGFALGFILMAEAACAFQVFRALEQLGVARMLAALCGFSYLALFVGFDGHRILLEPVYLFLALSAFRSCARPGGGRWHWAGALSALGLLVKQYGGFAFWGALGTAVGQRRGRAAALVVAGAAGTLLAAGLALAAVGVDLRLLARQSAGADYHTRWETVWLQLFLREAPFLVVGVLWLFRPRAPWTSERTLVCAFLVASCLPLLVRQHQYYLQNPSPFLFIAFGLATDAWVRQTTHSPLHWCVPLLATIALTSVPVGFARSQTRWTEAVKGAQIRRALLMTRVLAPEQPVLMFAMPSFYALTSYRSAEPRELGYRFLNESSPESVRAGMRRALAAWVDPASMYARGRFLGPGQTLASLLQTEGFSLQATLEDRYQLWSRDGVEGAPVER